jgi:magnesium transporter
MGPTDTPSPEATGGGRRARPSVKIGMSPGTLIHLGEAPNQAVTVELYHYEGAGPLERRVLADADEAAAYRHRPGVTWIDVNGVHDVALVERLGGAFELHPLLLEDVVNTHQRPKLESHGEHLFLVLKMLLDDPETDGFEVEQVSFVIGAGYVITFQERERDTFDSVRRRLVEPETRVRQHGADFLAYALVDTVVDNYFAVLERLGDRIADLEDDILVSPDRDTLEEVFGVKRSLVELRRAVWPLRDALAAMGRGDTPLIASGTLPYLRDVQDHALRVIDTIETYRDMATTMVEMYMSSVSNRLNEVMRVLTVIATIFIPLTFIAGVYGMNFSFMPELRWHWGYPVIWGVMVAIAVGLVVYFRRRGWT